MSVPVVFVHGIRVSGSMWRPQLALIGADRPVLAPDMPGHGGRRGEKFTMDGAVEVVSEAVGELGGRAVVVGLSMGGYVSIATAARHPDKVAALVAMGCTTVPTPTLVRPFLVAHRAFGGLADGGEAIGRSVFRMTLGRAAADAISAGGLATEAIPDVVAALTAFDPLTGLAAYPGPVWLVNGARDHLRAEEKRFLATCRDGKLMIVPGAGHLAPVSRPIETSALLNEVLTTVDDRRGWSSHAESG
jgi:pimeloyl-ACP methyl ester carboxylesterase